MNQGYLNFGCLERQSCVIGKGCRNTWWQAGTRYPEQQAVVLVCWLRALNYCFPFLAEVN